MPQIVRLCLFIATHCLTINSIAQDWNWIIKGNGHTAFQGQSNVINDIVQADNGFVYITGSFRDTLIIDEDTLVALNQTDAFVAKFDNQSNLIWSKHIASNGIVDCKAITINNNQKIVIGGYFQDDLIYHNGLTLNSFGNSELYLLWLNELGTPIQHEYTTGAGYAEIFDLTCDDNNNILITGNFFGTIAKDDVALLATNGLDFFCIQVNPSGHFNWGVQSVGGGNLSVGVSIDHNNDVYIAGSFEDGAEIGTGTYYSQNGNHNLFAAKYNNEGESEWEFVVTGFDEVHATGIHVNQANEIGVIGEFRQFIEIGPHIEQSAGAYDVLLFTLDTLGQLIEHQTFGGINNDIAYGIDTDIYDNFLLTGKFGYGVDFGNTTLSAVGTANTFIVKTNLTDVKWVKQLKGTGLNEGLCLHYGQNEEIYVGGTLRSSVYFNDDTLQAPSGKDFYLFQLADSINHEAYATIETFTGQTNPSLYLYPNPSNGQFSIRSEEIMTQIQLINLNGQIVYENNEVNTKEFALNLSLAPGLYTIKTHINKEVQHQKIIISH